MIHVLIIAVIDGVPRQEQEVFCELAVMSGLVWTSL